MGPRVLINGSWYKPILLISAFAGVSRIDVKKKRAAFAALCA